MKKIIFLILGLFCFKESDAFFVSEVLIRENFNLVIENQDDFFLVEQTEVLTNSGSQAETLFYYLPVGSVVDLEVYVEQVGTDFSLIKGYPALEVLTNQSKRYESTDFLKLAEIGQSGLLVLPSRILRPNESIKLKIKYRKKIDFIEDFYFSEIFTSDGIKTKNFHILLVLKSLVGIQKFIPLWEKGGTLVRSKSGIVWDFEVFDFVPQQNFSFSYSELSAALLKFPFMGSVYHWVSGPDPKVFVPEEIMIVLDASGSMYGAAWDKLKVVLADFLEGVSPETKVKIGFWTDNLEWMFEDFEINSRDFQKKVLSKMEYKVPLGKTNSNYLVSVLKESSADFENKETGLLFLMGDFGAVKTDSVFDLGVKVWVNYWENIDPFLKYGTLLGGGGVQKIFAQDFHFVEKSDFWRFFKSLHQPLLAPVNSNLMDVLPSQQISLGKSDSFFVGRVFDSVVPHYLKMASFVPRLWGKQKIASILKKNIPLRDYDPESLAAILSIGRSFGIQTTLFNENTSLEGLTSKLESVELEILMQVIWELQDVRGLLGFSNAQFVHNMPLYLNNLVWEQFDYWAKANSGNTLEIAPFSEAQKRLLMDFPDLFGPVFGAGDRVKYCFKFRCISVDPAFRKEFKPSDRLFWRGYHVDHWANEYLGALADLDILKLDKGGNAFPEKALTRGEYMQWVVEYFYGKDFERVILTPEIKRFSDLSESNVAFEAIYFLVQKGIVQGFPGNKVKPDKTLTRAEAVKILLSVMEITPAIDPTNNELLETFTDIPGWEGYWVLKAFEKGIIKGYGDKTFKPHKTLTRGEGAKIVVEGRR